MDGTMTTGVPAAAPGLSPRQLARRQRVLDVALALLDERDYDRIQVREVAESASVALATLYHYFPSKEHLFGEVLVQWASTLRTGVTRRPLVARSPAGRLEETLHRSVRAFERRPQLARLIGRLELSDDPFARSVLDRLDAVTADVYLDVLSELDPVLAVRIVRVANAVLDSSLRAWSSGRSTIGDVYRSLSDAVALLLPGTAPPVPPLRASGGRRPAAD